MSPLSIFSPGFPSKSSGALAVLALTASLLQPVVWAQSPATPANAPMQGMKGMPGNPTGATAMAGGGMDMQAMMKSNNEKMASMSMTGKADVDFAMMMRVHHQGAIDMAQAELRDGKEPQMKKMAKNIIAAQKKEIAELDRFLAKMGHPVEKMK